MNDRRVGGGAVGAAAVVGKKSKSRQTPGLGRSTEASLGAPASSPSASLREHDGGSGDLSMVSEMAGPSHSPAAGAEDLRGQSPGAPESVQETADLMELPALRALELALAEQDGEDLSTEESPPDEVAAWQ